MARRSRKFVEEAPGMSGFWGGVRVGPFFFGGRRVLQVKFVSYLLYPVAIVLVGALIANYLFH